MVRSSLAATLLVIQIGGCAPPAAGSPAPCTEALGLPGAYACGGECIVTAEGGQKVVEVRGERSTISAYPGTTAGLFRIDIESGDKTETEIGGLAAMVLHTATSAVSDAKFPVLEEYVFEVDPQCQATGYTKIVRNPTQDGFMACNIRCTR